MHDGLFCHQHPLFTHQLVDLRVGFKHLQICKVLHLGGESTRGVHGTVHLQSVLDSHQIVVLAMSGGGMNSTCALFKCDVVPQNTLRFSIQPGMPEDEIFQGLSLDRPYHRMALKTTLLGNLFQQLSGDDVDLI